MRWPLVVALVAVTAFVASATTVGAERLITGADIKDGSISGADIKKGSLKAEHLEAKARHAVFTSRRKRSTRSSTVTINSGQTANVASVSLPAGSYILFGQASVWAGGTVPAVYCGFTDSLGQLTQYTTQAWPSPLGGGYEASLPLAIVTAVTYSRSVTVNLTCYSEFALSEINYPAIVAEQVSIAPVT